jgi:uncharacterized protein (DUF1778 family)
MKIMIPVRVETNLKDFLQKFADKERRSLNNFIVNAVLTYTKDHHGVDWPDESEENPQK